MLRSGPALRKCGTGEHLFSLTLTWEDAVLSTAVMLLGLTLAVAVGGCGRGGDAKKNENALEEYSSTLVNSLDKAKKARAQASLPTIRLRIDQFQRERGRYPESLEELGTPDIPRQVLFYDAETGEVRLKQ